MARNTYTVVRAELEKIKALHGGKLRPLDVVNYIEDPKNARSPLQKYFSKGADAIRKCHLQEARLLIGKVYLVYTKPGPETKAFTRAYVSVAKVPGEKRCYRGVDEVISNVQLFSLYKEQLEADLVAIEHKVEMIGGPEALGLLKELRKAIRSAIKRDDFKGYNGEAREVG